MFASGSLAAAAINLQGAGEQIKVPIYVFALDKCHAIAKYLN